MFLAVATGLTVLPVPYLFFYFKALKVRRAETDQLEQTMNIITNSYISCYDIVYAIEQYCIKKNENLDERLRIRTPFDEFVINAKMTHSASIERSLQILEAKINNHYFSEWVKKLRLCMQNRKLVSALTPVIKAMNDAKIMQVEADTKMSKAWRDYSGTVAVMFGIVPMLRFVNADWYGILTTTPVGKFLLLLMLLSALLSAFFVTRVAKPVSL